MKEVYAHSSFEITTDCPYCDGYLDLTEELREALDPNDFLQSKDCDIEIKCPECNEIFLVKEIEF